MTGRARRLLLEADIVSVLLTVGLLAALVFMMVTINSQDRQITRLATNSDALRQQVKAQGETPVAPPAKDVTGKAGDPGVQGPRGVEGVPGLIGPTGVPGIPGIPGVTGTTGVAGANGIGGQDGTPGPTGAAGADSTVAGPAGATGEPAASWTTTDAAGLKSTCTRTTPFDPNSPTYQCAPTPAALVVPTP